MHTVPEDKFYIFQQGKRECFVCRIPGRTLSLPRNHAYLLMNDLLSGLSLGKIIVVIGYHQLPSFLPPGKPWEQAELPFVKQLSCCIHRSSLWVWAHLSDSSLKFK